MTVNLWFYFFLFYYFHTLKVKLRYVYVKFLGKPRVWELCVVQATCGIYHSIECCDSLSSFNYSNRQWKSRAMISHTSCRSPESARMMKDYTSAGWHELTTERLWSTRPKPGWRSTPRPGPNDHCHLLRRTPYGTWKTRSQESPAHHWGRTWVQTRGWSQLPPLIHPPIQLNTTLAQVRPLGRVT